MSVIGFIGSVFSPWYAWSGRKSPENHCCINVATYGSGGRFAMTDRGRSALRQTPEQLTVGPSSMRWTGSDLVISVDEVSSLPLISRIRGTITVTPSAITGVEMPLTRDGAHIWRPFGPTATITVDLEAPGWRWDGHGYFDANFGTRALEADFATWTWARFPTDTGSLCLYDARRRDGTTLNSAIAIDRDGSAQAVQAPPPVSMGRTLWALPRTTRADPGSRPRQVKAMLDAPFYNRCVAETQIDGQQLTGVHEALDLNRFRNPLIRAMLAVRVPRRRDWRFPPA